LILGEEQYLVGIPPIKAQNDHISANVGGHGPLGPLATPVTLNREIIQIYILNLPFSQTE